MSDQGLREALEKLIRDNVVIDRRPRDKHGPIGRLPEAKIPTSVLQDLLAAHPAESAPRPATATEQDLLDLVWELAGHLSNYAEDVSRLSGTPGWRTEPIKDVLARAAAVGGDRR